MTAMSFCSNWDSHQFVNTDMSFLQQEQDIIGDGDNILGVVDPSPFMDSYALPQYFQPNTYLYPETVNATNPYPYSGLSDDNFVLPFEPETYQFPKRQRSYPNQNQFDISNSNSNSNSVTCQVPGLLPGIPSVYGNGFGFEMGRSDLNNNHNNNNLKPKNNLSSQSIAARERRRKITDKTQELGKLIPGGHKMNTAEMFQAAANYVKFLQSQIEILRLIPFSPKPKQEKSQEFHVEEIQVLVASPTIQEKLASEKKCLVPRTFVEALATDHDIQTRPSIVDQIDKLLQNTGLEAQ